MCLYHARASSACGFVGGAGRGSLAPTQQYNCRAFMTWRRLARARKERAVRVQEDLGRPRRTQDDPGGLSVTQASRPWRTREPCQKETASRSRGNREEPGEGRGSQPEGQGGPRMTQEDQRGTMRTQPNEQIRGAACVIRTKTCSGGISKTRERERARERERQTT